MAGSRTEANVVLRHQCVKLREKSSSVIQFRIAPSSTHRLIWMNETLPETKTPITGNPVEINEEIFVGDNDTTYEVVSNMLSTSVPVDVLGREKIILEIIAKGLALVYVKYFSGVKTKLLIEVEIHAVTTHGATQEFEAEFNGCGFPATKRLKVGGHGQD